MNILVTGGAGFIGSHTLVELIAQGHHPVIVDNYCNSSRDVLKRLQKLTNHNIQAYDFDIRDTTALTSILTDENIEAVIHFAALKAVGESSQIPLAYYENNVGGLLSLLSAMKQSKVKQLIFSSSCTVYGEPDAIPISEDASLKTTTNPYGETKQIAERIISDVAKTGDISAVLLRYFNPIGAHPTGMIGELPNGTPNCLVPILTQAVAGVRGPLTVYGNDYPTPDGTCIRDYIHVVDLAKAHVKAVEYLSRQVTPTSVFNIGTGRGVSVLELIHAFESVNKISVPYIIGNRRQGDIAAIYASAEKAEKELGWKAEKSLDEALKDAWRWQQQLKN
ncbi:MAG TPA: UDP-glucose 4-epimerase GalE [Candidatus Saccharibacteria bacterium]|jgi:UDP-glucose 4-epimerase|nr:UDP-glucose 4-epimerase GalE [Candidatus Saccharibacteria bacterium]